VINFRNIEFNDRAPLYHQIFKHLRRQILLGEVKDGDVMPSRRELAKQTGVSLNTAQKAYRLMAKEGYIYTKGNTGSTIMLPLKLKEMVSDEMTRGLVQRFVDDAKQNQLSYKKVIGLLDELWDDE